MCSSLGWDESVDLVDDDGFDGAESFACVRGEEKVERFGRGDEDFAWVSFETGAIAGAGVAGADADLGEVDGDARALGHVGDAGERGAEVALDVDREGFQGRDVEDLAAFCFRRLAKHQAVETPEECGEGLAGAGGGEDEGGSRRGRWRANLRAGCAVTVSKTARNQAAVMGWKTARASGGGYVRGGRVLARLGAGGAWTGGRVVRGGNVDSGKRIRGLVRWMHGGHPSPPHRSSIFRISGL